MFIDELIDPEAPPPPFTCDGDGKLWEIRRCCQENGPCNEGEGVCFRDSECADGLRCGSRNCKSDFSTTASKWKPWMNPIQKTAETKQIFLII